LAGLRLGDGNEWSFFVRKLRQMLLFFFADSAVPITKESVTFEGGWWQWRRRMSVANRRCMPHCQNTLDFRCRVPRTRRSTDMLFRLCVLRQVGVHACWIINSDLWLNWAPTPINNTSLISFAVCFDWATKL
jgi:hypothetical protein